MFSRFSLRKKLLLLVLAPLLALGLLLVSLASLSMYDTLSRELLEKGSVLAGHGADMAAGPLASKDRFALQDMLSRFSGIDQDVAYVYVTDMAGTVLSHSLEGDFPDILQRVRDDWRDVAPAPPPVRFQGQDVYEIAAPVRGGELGIFHIGMSNRHIHAKTKESVKKLVGIGTVLLLAGLAGTFLFSLELTDPLAEVAEATRRIGGGDFEERVRVRSKDELGVLAGAVNDMAAKLQETTVSRSAYKAQKKFLESVFQSVTSPLLVIDAETLKIQQANGAAGKGWQGRTCHGHTHGRETPCGDTSVCPVILVRERGEPVIIEEIRRNGNGEERTYEIHGHPIFDDQGRVEKVIKQIMDISDRKAAEQERERLIGNLEKTIAEVKTLRGLLPICARCKKIRDTDSRWQPLDLYVARHSEAEFSHGVCPECAENLYGKFAKDAEKEQG